VGGKGRKEWVRVGGNEGLVSRAFKGRGGEQGGRGTGSRSSEAGNGVLPAQCKAPLGRSTVAASVARREHDMRLSDTMGIFY
jgi:hypothetical protein